MYVTLVRRIFWIDSHSAARSIRSSKFTGVDRRFLVRHGSGNLYRPVGLCANVDKRRLYWADPEFGTISTSDYDGNNVRHFRLPQSYASHVISLSVHRVSVLAN